jgi:uncharacterized protein
MLVRLVLTVALLSGAAQAQGFNCRYAKQPDEVRICDSDRLRALDERLSARFSRLRNELYGRERALLDREQASWLARRGRCRSDAECIENAYEQRLSELSRW